MNKYKAVNRRKQMQVISMSANRVVNAVKGYIEVYDWNKDTNHDIREADLQNLWDSILLGTAALNQAITSLREDV